MMTTLLLLLTLPGQEPDRAKVDPEQYPLALHRSMEIDDLDREIQRLHDTVIQKRAHLASSQRLTERGIMSRNNLAAEATSMRMDEAREAETIAYRALKVYERDVLGHAAPPDETKAYALLLEWARKQEAIAQVDAEYREYLVKQSRSLYQRRAISRQEVEDDELSYLMSLSSVALSRSRQGRVAMELAARRGEKPYDPAEYGRLRSDYLKAQARYYELTSELAHRRLEMARDRSRRGLIPANELEIFQKGADDADASLAEARKKLDVPESPPAPTLAPGRPS
jgi:hypothetical protein